MEPVPSALNWPTYRRAHRHLDPAEIRQQQQVVNYEQKIQSAFKEVADALAQRQSLVDQIAAQQRYLASLNITLQRATALYRHGGASQHRES